MIDYLVLGALQGIFEWLPVSSEGILVLVSMFSVPNPIDLAIFLHLGTTLSAIIYFRREIKNLLLPKNRPFLIFLVISTCISLIVAFPIYLALKNIATFYGAFILFVIGIALFVTGIILKKQVRGKRHMHTLTKKDALVVGVLQGLAVIPGLSRSATTIAGLLVLGIKQDDALKISFIMSIPVILAANMFFAMRGIHFNIGYVLALLTSFAAGILVMHALLSFSKKANFTIFCWVLGFLATISFLISIVFNI